jgi:hypothetical protein
MPSPRLMQDAAVQHIHTAANAAATLGIGLTYWLTVAAGTEKLNAGSHTRRGALDMLQDLMNQWTAKGDMVTGIRVKAEPRKSLTEPFTIGRVS